MKNKYGGNMKALKYIKKNGIKYTLKILWEYKIDKVIIKFMLLFLKKGKLNNTIVIESHNDFDSNGGAFYNYLISNGYNSNYKIIWLLKNKKVKDLPYNVKCFYLFSPNIVKDYYICTAKYFTADCQVVGKVRKEQISYYFSHGAFSLKNSSGKISIPSYVDYILIPSEYTRQIQMNQYHPKENTKMISLGFPVHDQLLSKCIPQLNKYTNKTYDKIIIWMPTFRKGGGRNRNDSYIDLPLGIPLLNDKTEYSCLDHSLNKNNVLLVIKIHPMQDMSTVKIKETENIIILTGEKVKEYKIDNYELLKESDALISDYSSIAYDYLMLNKPIGYVFSDLKYYKNGLVVEQPEELMAGPIIREYKDLEEFIISVVEENDEYAKKRKEVLHKIFDYCDGNACERIVHHMRLKK